MAKKISELTIEEFKELMCEVSAQKKYVHGLKGICDLFGCSKVTATALANGVLAPAVYKRGRLLVIDADEALRLFKEQ